MLGKPEKNIAIQFLPLVRGTRPYQRIIVSEQSRIRLDNKCVGELRYIHNRTDHYIPPNLMRPSGTEENRPSTIWTGFSSLLLGMRVNMEPRRLYRSTSKISPAANVGNTLTGATAASLLPPTETRKIKSWAEDIKEAVNPDDIPVEPPKELTQGETKIGRQRRLASSDSEDEDEPVVTSGALSTAVADRGDQPVLQARRRSDGSVDEEQEQPPTLGRPMADDEGHGQTAGENTQIQAGRRRQLRAADSDDSGDGEVPLPIPKSALKVDDTISNSFQEASKEIRGTTRRGRGISMQSNFLGRGMGSRFSTRGSEAHSHSQNQSERGRGGLWASKPEPGSPGQHRAQTQTRPMGRGYNHSTPPRGEQQPGRGQSVPRGRFRGSNSNRGRGRGEAIQHLDFGDDNLMDTEPATSTGPGMSPPGLDTRVELREEAFLPSANLLDEPLSDTQRDSAHPATSPCVTTPLNPPVAVNRFCTSSGSGPLYVNTFNPKPDVSAMEEEQLQKLLDYRDRLTRGREQISQSHVRKGTRKMSSPSEYSTARISSERLQANGEVSTRRFHHTMGQGAPNPSKKGKSQNREYKKERQARIAKAKAEAYGEPVMARNFEKPSSRIGSSSEEVDKGKDMSARKRRVLQTGRLAETDPATAEEDLRRSQTTKLIESLTPLFEAGRAFSGKLTFEIQFGQVVSAFSNAGGHNNVIDDQEWNRRFHPQLGMLPDVASFTNILTTNGADADRILEMKSSSPGRGSITVWSKTEPIPRYVSYEFQCQTQDNEEFWLVVHQNGVREIRPPSTTVGMVNLHFPGQIWDACAVVAGAMNHRFSEPGKLFRHLQFRYRSRWVSEPL